MARDKCHALMRMKQNIHTYTILILEHMSRAPILAARSLRQGENDALSSCRGFRD